MNDKKQCRDCQQFKPYSAFKRCESNKDGHQKICRTCRSALDRARYQQNIEVVRTDLNRQLRRRYGITLEAYEHLFKQQNGLCAACGRPEPRTHYKQVMRLAVDHCHVSGEIRGLLCSDCNRALGLLGDDVKRIEGLLQYKQRATERAKNA